MSALFAGTVAENIHYHGRPSACREEIVAAARKANAHDFIMAFTPRLRYRYWSARRQTLRRAKQRLSIARAYS